jgi:hypothetical protein
VSEPDVVATNSGYPCRYYPTVLSGPVFHWAHPGNPEFGVSAGRDGVMLHGLSPRFTRETLADLLDVLGLAGVVADNLGLDHSPGGVDAVKRMLVEYEREGETLT